MRVAICTIRDMRNCGNRLQNFALCSVLKKIGCECTTISALNKKENSFTKKLARLIKKLWCISFPPPLKIQNIDLLKNGYGEHFTSKHIPEKLIYNSDLEINFSNLEGYDYIIVGSDQVWNPLFWHSSYGYALKHNFLLESCNSITRIAYSASFGISELPKEWTSCFSKELNKFKVISVREESGAKIVKQLTGREAIVLIDPTMMLTTNEWLDISKKPRRVNCSKSYILTYFLGKRSEHVNADLHKYAKDNNLEIYNLLDKNQPELYITGPSEFIYLIAHAELIMTDSFHACVFSFLLHKPFLVYDRVGKENNMISRLDTLLGKFHLVRKYVGSGLPNEIFECNYEQGYKQLEIERIKAIKFLKTAISLDEESGEI